MTDPSIGTDTLFNVRTEHVEDTAAKARSTALELEEQARALKRYVHSLLGEWHGTAAANFGLTMGEFDRKADQMTLALHNLSHGLAATAANYEANEHANTKLVSLAPQANLS